MKVLSGLKRQNKMFEFDWKINNESIIRKEKGKKLFLRLDKTEKQCMSMLTFLCFMICLPLAIVNIWWSVSMFAVFLFILSAGVLDMLIENSKYTNYYDNDIYK